ncbi:MULTISPECIES: hypothetical protein [Serratia]|uniref:hypothetical protein n=1 Tax=Serratia TaxID=613 RepID=UPI001560631F|nr:MULTISPECIES: hypothetical protein [Serratia]NRN14042.1 hypothetical protein [Serratia marcescens]NRN37858.1 hypothetical protein [Serratia marcescens]
MLRSFDQFSDRPTRRVLLVSVVPEGPHSAAILLSGSFFDGDRRYTIERTMMMDYQRKGSNYTLRVKERVRKPLDDLNDEELNRRLPMLAPLLHWRIEQLDSQHYLFSGNHAPLFVCATS